MIVKLRYALLGHPVRHSVSPAMHAAALRAHGLPHSYSAIDVPAADGLPRLLAEIRRGALAGANVTVPYKQIVLEMVDEIAPSAAEVGAANVLCRDAAGRVIAHNTDVAALAAELGAGCAGHPTACAVIVGAGGAALAAVAACRSVGFHVVGVTTRSWSSTEVLYDAPAAEKARALGALTMPWPAADDAPAAGKGSQVLRMQWREIAATANLIVQATSAGMRGGDAGAEVLAAVPWAGLRPNALAYDVVYNPRITPFLRAAARHGLRTADGLGMLVRQAALSFELWTGLTAPMDLMRSAAEDALVRDSSR